jgi:hypothetical protein
MNNKLRNIAEQIGDKALSAYYGRTWSLGSKERAKGIEILYHKLIRTIRETSIWSLDDKVKAVSWLVTDEAIKTYHPWDVLNEVACKKKARAAVHQTIVDLIRDTENE